MKKRSIWLRILAGAAGFCIIWFLFASLNSLVGNPVSAAIATSKISEYVAETYPQENFKVPRASYNFKDRTYNVFIQSETSPDTRFNISIRKNGRIYDSYDSAVVHKFTTFERLENALDEEVDVIVKNGFPYRTRLVGASMKEKSEGMAEALTLDMPFDLHNLPLPIGLTVWTDTEQPSYEILAQRLLELKLLMEQNNVAVSSYSLSLEYPYHEENGELMPENFDDICVHDFPAERIVDNQDLPRVLEEYQKQRDAEDEKAKDAEKKQAIDKESVEKFLNKD